MQIVIIGNGIAGITCARHIRKNSDAKITIISKESEHFYSRTALMYIYMGHMPYEDTKPYEDWFWEKNNINLVFDEVISIDSNAKKLKLILNSTIVYDKLVIASGSSPNKFGWPGQDLTGVQGLYSLQDLQSMSEHTQHIERAVVVGGGLIGIEMAEMLLSRDIKVTMLVRESSFWNNVLPSGESNMINKHIREHHVDLRLSTELKAITSDGNGKACAVITDKDEKIKCGFVGLTVGVHPNINFLKDSGVETNRGVLVNNFFETSVENIYAVGDCAEFRKALPNRKTIEQVWYTGKMQGATVAQTICGNKTPYQPGYWFNSAKFFDIEYQTYGNVPAKLKENEASFYWEHRDNKKCMHLVYDKNAMRFLGINVFGLRCRHHLFNQFLEEERDIKYVIENLPAANFDPEFYNDFEYFLQSSFNQRFPKNKIEKQSKKGWKAFSSIFKAAKV